MSKMGPPFSDLSVYSITCNLLSIMNRAGEHSAGISPPNLGFLHTYPGGPVLVSDLNHSD